MIINYLAAHGFFVVNANGIDNHNSPTAHLTSQTSYEKLQLQYQLQNDLLQANPTQVYNQMTMGDTSALYGENIADINHVAATQISDLGEWEERNGPMLSPTTVDIDTQ
ncbi:hypothetical protein FRX31_033015, partial [Thalictrum thalictroides]